VQPPKNFRAGRTVISFGLQVAAREGLAWRRGAGLTQPGGKPSVNVESDANKTVVDKSEGAGNPSGLRVILNS